jgi:hypothetical protein
VSDTLECVMVLSHWSSMESTATCARINDNVSDTLKCVMICGSNGDGTSRVVRLEKCAHVIEHCNTHHALTITHTGTGTGTHAHT